MYNVRVKILVEVYMTEDGIPVDEDQKPELRKATIEFGGNPGNYDDTQPYAGLAGHLVRSAVLDRATAFLSF